MVSIKTACALLLAFSTRVFAQETVGWNAPDYLHQFKYFQENTLYTDASWSALYPAEQARELSKYSEPALNRQEAVSRFYAEIMRPWSTAQTQQNISAGTEPAKAVFLWLGAEQGRTLSLKITQVSSLAAKAWTQGIDDRDAAALSPHLTTDAINALRACRPGRATDGNSLAGMPPANGVAMRGMERLAGSGADALSFSHLARFYDGKIAAGDVPVALGEGLPAADSVRRAGGPVLPASRSATPIRTVKIAPLSKGTNESTPLKIIPDAYGITVYTKNASQPTAFRSGAEAEGYIRGLPAGSITRIVFYGHGMPGIQTVGDYSLNAQEAASILRGKMAPSGVVVFEGCNTSGVGSSISINPLYGLSVLARRLIYFTPQYIQDRLNGSTARDARQLCEKEWNSDLARDSSLALGGAIVCGNRTFGLVPERLPLIAHVTRRMEATRPAFVVARKGCYRNGEEVPAP